MRKPTTRKQTEYFVMATHKRRTTCLGKSFLISKARRDLRWFRDGTTDTTKFYILAITTVTTKTFKVVK